MKWLTYETISHLHIRLNTLNWWFVLNLFDWLTTCVPSLLDCHSVARSQEWSWSTALSQLIRLMAKTMKIWPSLLGVVLFKPDIYPMFCQLSAPWVALISVMGSRENSRGQCRHCLSVLTLVWHGLDEWVWLRLRRGGGAHSVFPSSALAQETFLWDPSRLWQINGGICKLEASTTWWLGTEAGGTGWIFITGRYFTPSAPCRLFPVLRWRQKGRT